MAAIDPSAEPEDAGTTKISNKPRATLKMVYDPAGPGDEDDSEDEDDEENYLKQLLAVKGDDDDNDDDDDEDDDDEEDDDDDEDEDSSDDEEEKNGGPSDPSKTKKARKQAALEQILASMGDDDDQDEMDVDASPKVNGGVKATNKGKGKALEKDDEDVEDDNEDDLEELGMEEVVICTLDPEKVSNTFVHRRTSSNTDESLYRITNKPSTSRCQRTRMRTSKSPVLTPFISPATMSSQQIMATAMAKIYMMTRTLKTTTISSQMRMNLMRTQVTISTTSRIPEFLRLVLTRRQKPRNL